MIRSILPRIKYLVSQALSFLLLIAVVGVMVLGFFPIKSRFLTQYATSIIKKSGVDSCSIHSVTVVPWRSIRFKRVYLGGHSNSTDEWKIRVADATIPVGILQLFLSKGKIYKALSLTADDPGSSAGTPQQRLAKRVLALSTVFKKGLNGTFKDVWCTIKLNGKVAFLGTGGRVEVAPLENSNTQVLLEFEFPVVNTFGDGIQDVRGVAMLTPDGRFSLGDFTATYFDGSLNAKGDIALFDRNLPVSYILNIDRMDFSYWYSMHVGVGKFSGLATVASRGEDIPLKNITTTASLSATVENCKINDHPLQQSLATSLFVPSLSSLSFEKLVLQLKKNSSDTIRAVCSGTGEEVSFNSKGWILQTGTLQHAITGSLSAKMIKKLPPLIRKSLVADKNKKWKFSCRLYGSLADPRFELDKETLERAVSGIFTSFQQDIFNLLMK